MATRDRKLGTTQARPMRPDALVISSVDEKSYVDILTKMKGDPELEQLGSSVNKIRKKLAGNDLLETQRNSDVRRCFKRVSK